MHPKIVAVVGHIRAGKTTVSRYLAERHGYGIASNSALLTEIATKLGLSPDRPTLKLLGDALFSTLGNGVLAHFRIDEGRFPIVVDGLRYHEEIAIYRREPTFRLLGVVASGDDRYKRAAALAHESKDGPITRQQFESLSTARSEVHVDSLVRSADCVVENNSSIEALGRKIDEIVSGWSARS